MTVKNAINLRKTIKKYDSSKTINNNDLSMIYQQLLKQDVWHCVH